MSGSDYIVGEPDVMLEGGGISGGECVGKWGVGVGLGRVALCLRYEAFGVLGPGPEDGAGGGLFEHLEVTRP